MFTGLTAGLSGVVYLILWMFFGVPVLLDVVFWSALVVVLYMLFTTTTKEKDL